MPYRLLIISLFFLLISCEDEEPSCDGGTFVGDVFLTTQAEIDAFGAKCYTEIDGELRIGDKDIDSDIVDLTPLNSLITVGSHFFLHHNSNLETLRGLQNLSFVEGFLIIASNEKIKNLKGLDNLKYINGDLTILNNSSLETISDLPSLKAANILDIYISENESLLNLDGLEGITEIAALHIENNESLVSLEGLSDLRIISGDFTGIIQIFSNNSLKSLKGLEKLTAVKFFVAIGERSNGFPLPNPNLTDFCALANLLENGYYRNIYINNNAYNPSISEIINGNCKK